MACGVSATDAPAKRELPAVQASPLAPTASSTPAIMATPTETGTPTTDYNAQISQEQLALQRSLGSATVSSITQDAISAAQGTLDAQKHATATVTVAVGQTAEAHAIQTQDAIKTATVQAPITRRLEEVAYWEPWWQFIWVVGSIGTILLVGWCIIALTNQGLKYIYEKRLALSGRSVQAGPVTMTLDNRDKYGWGSVDFTTLPIDRLTLQMVAEMITSGSHYTQAQMTGKGNPLVKDGTFNSFGEWMVKNGIAYKTDDGRYPIRHYEFFEKVLET